MSGKNNLVRIFTGSQILVDLLRSELNKIDVSSHTKNTFQSGIKAGIPTGVPSAIDLYIQEEDLSKAESVIKEFKEANS